MGFLTALLSGLSLGQVTPEKKYSFQSQYLTYKESLKNLERVSLLRAQGLVAENEFDQAKLRLEKDKLELQKSFAALLLLKPELAVTGLTKTRGASGEPELVVVLENHTEVLPEHLGLTAAELLELFDRNLDDLNTVHNLYLSLCNEGGVVIGQPYTVRLEKLAKGERREVAFRLLDDVETVLLRLRLGDETREYKFKPAVAASFNQVVIQADHFAQEAWLGTEIAYKLRFEAFAASATAYSYMVRGLPPEIQHKLTDEATKSAVSKLGFTATQKSANLALGLSLPQEPGSIPLDKPIPFTLELTPVGAPRAGTTPIGKVQLEVTVRSSAKLELYAANLLKQVRGGTAFPLGFFIKNTGQKRVYQPQLEVGVPPQWKWAISRQPAEVAVNTAEETELRLTPPPGLAPGDYTVTVKAFCSDGGRKVETEELLFRVENTVEHSDTGQYVIIGLLGVLLAAIVGFAVRFARK